MTKIGEQIKALRQKRGLTQDQLGDKIGWKKAYISQIEQGDHTPNIESMKKIAKGLEIAPAVLINAGAAKCWAVFFTLSGFPSDDIMIFYEEEKARDYYNILLAKNKITEEENHNDKLDVWFISTTIQ